MKPLALVLLALASLASLVTAYEGRRSLVVKPTPVRCRQPWTCARRVRTRISSYERNVFVGTHNWYRSLAKTPNPIGNLAWNADLAAYAQDWVNHLLGGACNDTLENLQNGLVGNITTGQAGSNRTIFVRNGTIVDVGENIFYAQITEYQRRSRSLYFRAEWPRKVTDFWVRSQRGNYDFVNKTCVTDPCADYLQVMWNTTRLLGCGYNDCKIAFNQAGIPKANVTLRIVSCNYFPAGVYEGINPY